MNYNAFLAREAPIPFERQLGEIAQPRNVFNLAFNAFGNTVSLTEEEAAYYIKRFRSIEVYL